MTTYTTRRQVRAAQQAQSPTAHYGADGRILPEIAAHRAALCAAEGDDDDSEGRECMGHPAGPFDPMGETVYCDGSCIRAAAIKLGRSS